MQRKSCLGCSPTFIKYLTMSLAFWRARVELHLPQMVKSVPATQETGVQSLDWEDPLEKGEWQPTLVFLPEESHGQRSLAGCSPWSHKELGTTERLTQSNFFFLKAFNLKKNKD